MSIEYDTLPGRGSENARKALDLAIERGFTEEDVRTTRSGYLVPVEDTKVARDLGLSGQEATANAWDGDANSGASDAEGHPTDGMKVPELNDYIETHNLDVDLDLKKDDKIAAIKAAENKE